MRLNELGQQLPYLPGLLAQLSLQALLEKLHTQRGYLGQDAATRYQTFLRLQPEIAQRVPQHVIASYLGITSNRSAACGRPASNTLERIPSPSTYRPAGNPTP